MKKYGEGLHENILAGIWFDERSTFSEAQWHALKPSDIKFNVGGDMSEGSFYKSTTEGFIPLSFTGRYLMKRLRDSVQDAVKAGHTEVNANQLSRDRAKLAMRMSELERDLQAAKAKANPPEDWQRQLYARDEDIRDLMGKNMMKDEFIARGDRIIKHLEEQLSLKTKEIERFRKQRYLELGDWRYF